MHYPSQTLILLREGSQSALCRVLGALGEGVSRLATRLGPAAQEAVLRPLVAPLVSDELDLRVTFEKRWTEIVRARVNSGQSRLTPDDERAAPACSRDGRPPSGILHLSRLVEERLVQLRRLRRFHDLDDPVEAVHQLRVASRRLLAFVDMFEAFVGTKEARASRRPLRRLTRAVRSLRDCDVHVDRLDARLTRAETRAERLALRYLQDRERKRHRRLTRKAKRQLARVDCDALARALRRVLDGIALRAQAPSMTYGLLAELAFRPVAEAARAARPTSVHPDSARQWHGFRLALKRLRYSAELIEPALGDGYADVHGGARKLQEILGSYQDSVVFEESLSKAYSRLSGTGDTQLVRGLEVLLEKVRTDSIELLRQCVMQCDALVGPRLFAQANAPARPSSAGVSAPGRVARDQGCQRRTRGDAPAVV